jgi:serine/threonine-protein kinase
MSRMTEQIGRVLGGRYRLLSPLGAGASAQVYLADDVRLRRQVAVKVLHPALADDESFLRRFRAEAQSAASLSHPHLLAVFDWSGDDETPFLVTEYLSGGSLRALLDAGQRLSASQALVIGLEAARALDHAHRQGFVHRDIKPANLLFGADGRLHIADFGLARAIAEAGWTETGAVLGTARYASPEQARGEQVDGRSDVYSLALVIIEAVTGQVPFTADTTIGTLMARLDRSIDVPQELGPLSPLLARAGTVDRELRIDAGALAAGFVAAAPDLSRPTPLALVGAMPVAAPQEIRDPTLMSRSGVAAAGAATAAGPMAGGLAPPTGAGAGAGADTGRVAAVGPAAGVQAPAAPAGLGSEATQLVSEIEPAATNVLAVPATGLPPHRPVGPPPVRSGYEPADGLSRGDRSARRLMLGAAVVVLAAALGVIGGWSYMQSQVPSHVVPETLVGMQRRDVEGAVRDFRWDVVFEETRQDGTQPGQVLETRPAGGASLKEGSKLTVVVSEGATLIDLPAGLVGMTEGDARTALEDAGLVAALIPAPSDDVEEGIVTGFVDGEPQAQVAKGSTVSLFVSSGSQLEIPDLEGESYADAVAELEAVGLEVEAEGEQDDDREPGEVIRTEPGAGTEVEEGDSVVVVVAVDQVDVPDLEGKSLDDATEAIEDAGLTVGSIIGPEDGRVMTSWPFEGTEVESGSTVDLVLRPGR